MRHFTRLAAFVLGISLIGGAIVSAEDYVFNQNGPQEWTVRIRPSTSQNNATRAASYDSVYNTIPFRRSDYVANPNYRHDATMEFLFDKMRHGVMIQYGRGQTVDQADASRIKAWKDNRIKH